MPVIERHITTMPKAQFDITVAGELNLDMILYGLPETLEPEKELLARDLSMTLGSSSAIFAHNLAVMGNRVGFVSLIGDDPLGGIAVERLGEAGVELSRVRKTRGKTKTGLTVILAREGCRNILTYPGTMAEMSWDDLDLDYLRSAKHFHLSSLYLMPSLRPRVPDLFKEMKSAGLSTSLDTNDDPDGRWEGLGEVLRHVDILFVNEREAKMIGGDQDLENSIEKLAARVPIVAVKLGVAGGRVRRGAEEFRHAGFECKAIDPVGAGDSFDAGFLHQFVRGKSLQECLKYGNLAGAFSTTQAGGTEAFRDAAAWKQFVQHKTDEAAA